MYIVTQVKQKFAVFTATKNQAHVFMTDPKYSINGKVWTVAKEEDIADMSTKEQVGLFNQLQDVQLVKFRSKTDGAHRVFPLLKGKAGDFDSISLQKPKNSKGFILLDPQIDRGNVYPCRAGSKQASLVDALKNGATMAQLIKVCSSSNGGKNWTETSVKSGIYWDVNKLKGYGVRTELLKNGVHKYFLTYPEGMNEPLPHTPVRKPKVAS